MSQLPPPVEPAPGKPLAFMSETERVFWRDAFIAALSSFLPDPKISNPGRHAVGYADAAVLSYRERCGL